MFLLHIFLPTPPGRLVGSVHRCFRNSAGSGDRLPDLLAFVFEKPNKITEKTDCEKMQNDVEKNGAIVILLRLKRYFPVVVEKREVCGFWYSQSPGLASW